MSNSVEFPELAETLKRLLKQRGITYRSLAKSLKISESSVKKVFIGKDCSLQRLNQICHVIDVQLTDLMLAAREQVPEKFRFSEKQEKFLVTNRKCFQVYWKLVYEETPPESLRKELSLSETTLFKALRSLDQLGLIELQANGKVKCPDMNMVLWESSGVLVDMVRKEWAPRIMTRVGERAGQQGYGLTLRHFALSEESANELKRTIDEIQFEFGRRSVREKKLNQGQVKSLFMVTAFSARSFVEEL